MARHLILEITASDSASSGTFTNSGIQNSLHLHSLAPTVLDGNVPAPNVVALPNSGVANRTTVTEMDRLGRNQVSINSNHSGELRLVSWIVLRLVFG
jgi:hypothetical protein